MGKVKTATINRKQDSGSSLDSIDGKQIKEMARDRAFDNAHDRVQPEQIKDLERFNHPDNPQIYHLNYLMHEFVEKFHDNIDHYVTLFYPYAKDEAGKNSPVYVDIPKTARQLDVCFQKAALMKKAKKTYYIYRPDQTQPLVTGAQEAQDASEGEEESDE